MRYRINKFSKFAQLFPREFVSSVSVEPYGTLVLVLGYSQSQALSRTLGQPLVYRTWTWVVWAARMVQEDGQGQPGMEGGSVAGDLEPGMEAESEVGGQESGDEAGDHVGPVAEQGGCVGRQVVQPHSCGVGCVQTVGGCLHLVVCSQGEVDRRGQRSNFAGLCPRTSPPAGTWELGHKIERKLLDKFALEHFGNGLKSRILEQILHNNLEQLH